jgi:NAD(P)-dependent dehydrogenase (short-subunit alcohol dehydrogenase family)
VGARFVSMDVTDDASVTTALERIDAEAGLLDVLVHNAGILDTSLSGPAALRSFDTNAAGIVRVTQAALPLLQRSADPNVVTVSSAAGSFALALDPASPIYDMPLALYSASKAAATMLTMHYAKMYPAIRFNALEPGTTATDMTAAFGIGRSVDETADVVVRWATTTKGGPTGTFADENGALPW